MSDTLFDVDANAMQRRVMAAIRNTSVNRFEVEFEWPECHKPKCQHRHGDPSQAMKLMQHQMAEAVDHEMRFHLTTRPDLGETDERPESAAVLNLAVLLGRYNVHDAGTWARAAQLIIDAYPELIPALAGSNA